MSPLHGHISAVDCRSRHWFTALSITFWSNDAYLLSVVLSDGRRHGSGSGRLVPAESSKSRSLPDWDLNCSVANSVGWWCRVYLLTAVQQSHGLGWLELDCPAGRWRNHQTQNEWLAGSNCCLSSHSSVTEICDSSFSASEMTYIVSGGALNSTHLLWQQLGRIENLLNRTTDLY